MLKRILRLVVAHPVATLFVVFCLVLIGFAISARTGADPDDARIAQALATPTSITAAFAQFDIALREAPRPDDLGDGVVALTNFDADEFNPALSAEEGYVTVLVFPDEDARVAHEETLVGDAARVFARANVAVLYAPGLRDLSDKIGELVPPIPVRIDITPEP